jgi:hypothetical protein
MRALRWTVAASLLALSGCSLVLKPDYDAIAPDLDAGRPPDASDGGDAGIDAEVDGGMRCTPLHLREMVCDDHDDEDCDGQIDCFDFDCRGASVCCRPRAVRETSCLESLTDWNRFPTDASDLTLSGSCGGTRITSFGPPGSTRALISAECQPINFGMRFELDFFIHLICGGGACDYAALSLTPVPTLLEGAPLPSELRAIVLADGSARVERSGTTLAELPVGTFEVSDRDPVHLTMDLEPGPYAGGDVLFATVQLTQDTAPRTGGTILDHVAVMPLADLRCLGGDAGLYAAIEGAGDGVGVIGPFTYTQYECSNPSQFEPQPDVDTSRVLACAAGGVGAPALVNYCRDACDNPDSQQIQWDLWVDSSDTDRGQEQYRFVDFGICGYAQQNPALPNGTNGDWLARPAESGSFLWSVPPSVREPTILPLTDQSSTHQVERLWYAFAERSGSAEVYALRGGELSTRPTDAPGTIHDLLAPADTGAPMSGAGCASLRDPLLVADWVRADDAFAVEGAWLFFTCVHEGEAPSSIGVVHIGDDLSADLETLRTDALTSSVGAYASRGVSAPEGFSEARGTRAELTVRLWFSARDGSGRMRMGYAQGRGDLNVEPPELPPLEPYPANPILDGANEVLGGDCSRDCAFEGVSVTPSMNDVGKYQFLVARSRDTATSTVHELVPLLQPAPSD